jgi:hypothetical protein
LPVARVPVDVSSSLPTGTVSRPSAGTRTFPSEPDADADGTRAATESSPDSPRTGSPPSTPRPTLPDGVVPRREHDVALSRADDRVAELERENAALRDYIETQAAQRRAVVERYERLLDRRDATDSSATAHDPAERGVVATVRSALGRLRSRLLVSFGRD